MMMGTPQAPEPEVLWLSWVDNGPILVLRIPETSVNYGLTENHVQIVNEVMGLTMSATHQNISEIDVSGLAINQLRAANVWPEEIGAMLQQIGSTRAIGLGSNTVSQRRMAHLALALALTMDLAQEQRARDRGQGSGVMVASQPDLHRWMPDYREVVRRLGMGNLAYHMWEASKRDPLPMPPPPPTPRQKLQAMARATGMVQEPVVRDPFCTVDEVRQRTYCVACLKDFTDEHLIASSHVKALQRGVAQTINWLRQQNPSRRPPLCVAELHDDVLEAGQAARGQTNHA